VDQQNSVMSSSKDRFSALFEHATEGILVVDSLGIITLTNPACERLFGYLSGELTGKPIEMLIPRRFTHHQTYREQYNYNPRPRSMGIGLDLFGIRKDSSEFPVEISLSPFENEEGNFVIAFIIDITLRKRVEEIQKKQKEDLERLANELEKRVKDRTMILEEALHELENSREELSVALEKEKELNEFKSRFVSMASHEFRTPLATILSSVSLVTKYGENGDKENQMRHINRIKNSITHLTDILNDILSISKLEEGKIIISSELFDIAEFTTLVIQELQAVVKTGQQIDYHHSGNKKVRLDNKLLKNILFNLLSNASKFSPESALIEVFTNVNDSIIELKVKDYGIGIPDEDQEHLFERFFRGNNVTNIQGTGLGLNIVAKYVELMNGNITFESKAGQGTTFIINLPNYIE
jgi:PAS domain S-box-containing protein